MANDLIAEVKDLTGGRGAHRMPECAGNEKALQTMLETARPGAEIVILGKTNVNKMVSLRFELITLGEINDGFAAMARGGAVRTVITL